MSQSARVKTVALVAGFAMAGMAGLVLGTPGWEPPTAPQVAPPAREVVAAPPGETAHERRDLTSPLEGPLRLVHPFRAPSSEWGPGHRGADLAAEVGQQVVAPASGTVSFSGTVVDRGVVTVQHAGGLRSSLEPVEPLVRAGEHVDRGQPVGVLSDEPGHCAPASCLHWGLRRGSVYLDPIDWLIGFGPIVLLPTGASRH